MAVRLEPWLAEIAFAFPPPFASNPEFPIRPPLQGDLAAQCLDIRSQNVARGEALEIEIVMVVDRVDVVVDPVVFHDRSDRPAAADRAPPIDARLIPDHGGLVVRAEGEVV